MSSTAAVGLTVVVALAAAAVGVVAAVETLVVQVEDWACIQKTEA